MLRFLTSGESHGQALVALLEGFPAGLAVDVDKINHELWRRQQGYGRGSRQKIEKDTAQILSGVRHGITTGAPIAMMIKNRDWDNWQDVMSTEAVDLEDPDIAAKMAKKKSSIFDPVMLIWLEQ